MNNCFSLKILKEDFENKDQLYVIKLDNYIAELEILSNSLKKGKEKYREHIFFLFFV